MSSPKDKIKTTVVGPSISGKSMLVASSAMFKRVFGKNKGIASFYIQVFDLVAIPPDGAVTHRFAPVEVIAGASFDIDLILNPIVFYNGICICASSTDTLKTLIVGNDMVGNLLYSDKQ